MIIGLRDKIEGYSEKIRKKCPDYPALYEYFLLFMEQSPRYYDKKQYDVDSLFRDELTRSDIVGACVYYIEHSNAKGESAIEKFLNAMTKMYRTLIAPYHNETLAKSVPFSKLSNEVLQKVTKELEQAKPFPPITEDDYKQIILYFRNHARGTELKTQKEIIAMLLLLFGFKFERIRDLRRDSIKHASATLRITTKANIEIELPLPDRIKLMMKTYMDKSSGKSEYLFSDKNGKQITPAFIDYAFRRIKKLAKKPDSCISATGLSKYAILKMIEKRVDFITIKDITGMDDDIINDCARIYLQRISENDKKCDIKSLIYSMDVFKELNGPISD